MHILNKKNPYIVKNEEKIIDIMKKMNKSKYKFLIVLNKNKIFLGTITDGDLRRNLIRKNFNQDLKASDIMAKKTVISLSSNEKTNYLLMKSKSIFFLPILDKNKKLKKILVKDNLIDNSPFKKKCNQKIILMAGGKGLRLRPLTKNLPKPMLKISKKRIIEKIIFDFVKQGYTDFIITVNYLKKKIKDFIGDGSKFNCKVRYFDEKNYMGTAGSLSKINLNNYKQESILVMNSDLVTDIEYKRLIDYHEKKGADLTVCSKFKDFTLPFGELKISNNLAIKSIKEKPQKSYFVNLGIYVFKTNILKKLKDKKFRMMNDLIEHLLKKKAKVITFPVYEDWQDIGNKKDFISLKRKKYRG